VLERPAEVKEEEADIGLVEEVAEENVEEADIGFVGVDELEYANEDAVEDFGGIGGKPDEGGEAEVYDG
jgi:hypothetical protein